MAIKQAESITKKYGRHGMVETVPAIQSLADLAATLTVLPSGETLVAVIDCEEGHYLFIGNSLVHHLWAVTTQELQILKSILLQKDCGPAL